MQTVTIGGERLGAGKKMKADMHGFERSTHNQSRIFRSTMSSGTLVPCFVEIGLPGTTFDIDIDADVKTHPTVGPLFGSYKLQIDIFEAPFRLYQGKLHNNALNIGLNMASIKLPLVTLWATEAPGITTESMNTRQINQSCIFAYLGIRGVGYIPPGTAIQGRDFNACFLIAYWDIYKNYFANKQEEIGAVIHTPRTPIVQNITSIEVDSQPVPTPNPGLPAILQTQNSIMEIALNAPGADYNLDQIELNIDGTWQPLINYYSFLAETAALVHLYYNTPNDSTLTGWRYVNASTTPFQSPQVSTFDLDNIDDMRNAILGHSVNNTAYVINTLNLPPYSWVAPLVAPATPEDIPYIMSQEGLAVKTYQSDLFNNWIRTEWITGPDSITELTRISTVGDSFTIDQLVLARKVYDMLNRIAISGGSYKNWIEAAYDHQPFSAIESPVYHGGLSKELVFQEVVSNSATNENGTNQPLGTLAGKGVMSNKHKGGKVHIKTNEPSIIMGIVSLTPRIDYSQGNMWWSHLITMDDFHKPNLDQIGFQDLITEQMAYWSTEWSAGNWITKSAGKQPAWINYMTAYNQTYGNFATENNEMFMTLNRRYERVSDEIQDLTTYIDPVKFNHIFAQTSIDAQNFWVQIAFDVISRRKMSAKIIPNL